MVKIGVFWPKIDLFGVKIGVFWKVSMTYLGEIPKKGSKWSKKGPKSTLGLQAGSPNILYVYNRNIGPRMSFF